MSRPPKKSQPTPVPTAQPPEPRIPQYAIWPIFAAWTVYFWRNYFEKYPIYEEAIAKFISISKYFTDVNASSFANWDTYGLNLLKLVWILAACWAVGKLLLILFKFEDLTAWEDTIYSFCLGMAGLMTAVFLLGIAGFFSKSAIRVVMGLAGASVFFAWKFRPETPPLRRKDLVPNFYEGTLGLLILIAFIFNLVMAFVPETFYDSLVYHLHVPDHYLREGRIGRMPANIYSNMPLAMSMLYGIGLALGDEFLAKLVGMSCGLLAFLSLWKLSARFFPSIVGLLAGFSFYLVPMVAMNGWLAGTEMGLTLFETLSLFAVLRGLAGRNAPAAEIRTGWRPEQQAPPTIPKPSMRDRLRQHRWFVLAGLFGGTAMTIKYPGAFCLIALTAVILLAGELRAVKTRIEPVVWFGAAATLVFLPWAARNFALTGSPVFPYLYAWPAELLSYFERFQADLWPPPRSLKDYLTLPWVLTMREGGNSNSLGPIYLFAMPLLLFFKKWPVTVRALLVYFLIHYVLWSVSTSMGRYFIPALPGSALLLAYIVCEAGMWRWVKPLLKGGILLGGMVGLYTIMTYLHTWQGWKVILNQTNKTAYLKSDQNGYPSPYYGVADWANKNIPADARVLFIGEGRGFYVDRARLVPTVYDPNPFWKWLSAAATVDELLKTFQREKITHIFLSVREGVRIDKTYGAFQWTDREMDLLDGLWARHIRRLYSDNLVYLYEVVPEGTDAAPVNFLRAIDFVRKKQVNSYWNFAQARDDAGALSEDERKTLSYIFAYYKEVGWSPLEKFEAFGPQP